MIHEDDPDAAAGQNREVVEGRHRGGHDDAAHVQTRQHAHELALTVGVGVSRPQHGDPTVLAQTVLDAASGLGEERVGDVVDQHPDQRGAAAAQVPSRFRADEAEFADRRMDPIQS